MSGAARRRINLQRVPMIVTMVLFVLMFGSGTFAYNFSAQVFLNLFIDNAFLIVTAMGMTFVILSGGIDLSVGSVIALTTMISAVLIEHHHWSPFAVIPLVLVLGAGFGAVMGAVIHYFKLQAFIVTLAGMFLARGLCYLLSIDTITINEPLYTAISQHRIELWGELFISWNVIIALGVVALAVFIAHFTSFGRNVYAIGGNERSALLMGLPVARTRVLVYTLSGFCSALAGVIFTFYMLSGYGLHAQGMELDAIAAAVIGGTLLSGGAGYMIGTVFGVLILGLIQTLITFDGSLSAWWTKIAIGILLCVFCVLQRVIEHRAAADKRGGGNASGKLSEAKSAADKTVQPVVVSSHAAPMSSPVFAAPQGNQA
ncbi:MAG TPA: galactofuranose ABC transporter, permease protein YjfF [Rhodocyclaceae bacterium]|nr:galactofuranose ABC transporter, permease protein YjfF [Rhodocyclaceae bacterium]